MTGAYVQTYDNLVADVINYMERDDAQFVAQIPNLIGLAESAIAAELKTFLQLVVVETNLAANQVVLNKPARWRKTISMKVNGQPILLRSQDYVAQYQNESSSGQPFITLIMIIIIGLLHHIQINPIQLKLLIIV